MVGGGEDHVGIAAEVAVVVDVADDLFAEQPLTRRKVEHLQLIPEVVGEVAALDRDRLDVFQLLVLFLLPADVEAVEEDLLPIHFVVLLDLFLLLLGGLLGDFLFLRLLELQERVVEELGLQVLLQVEHRHVQHVHRLVEARIDAELLAKPAGLTKRSVYEFAIQFDEDSPLFMVDKARVAAALSAELGFSCWQADAPLPRSVYFRPETKARFAWSVEQDTRARGRSHPGAERFHSSTVLFHHRALLGDPEHAEAIVESVEKLNRHVDALG